MSLIQQINVKHAVLYQEIWLIVKHVQVLYYVYLVLTLLNNIYRMIDKDVLQRVK